MAQTARDTITHALVLLGVAVGGRAPTAVEASDALKALNNMIHAWKGQGVDVGHIDLTLSQNLALAPEHFEAVEALLAIRLAPDYEAPVSPALAAIASNGWAALQAKYIINDPNNDMIVDKGLRRLGAFRSYGSYWPNN